MTRDNILFTVCGFIIGLVVGALALGPVLYRGGITSRSLFQPRAASANTAPALPSSSMPGAAGPISGDPAVMQNVLQQVAQLKAELQRDPKNAAAAIQLANLYMDARKYPQAITYYEQGLALHDDPDVKTDLGICYRATGDLPRALATFDEIQKKSPGHWQSLFNKAVVLVDLKRTAEARAIVDRLKKERSSDPDVARFDEVLRQMEK